MRIYEIISQLESLKEHVEIQDNPEDDFEVWKNDSKALEKAIKVFRNLNKKLYKCKDCKGVALRNDSFRNQKYEDDYLITCEDCGNWEQIGNNKSTHFEKM